MRSRIIYDGKELNIGYYPDGTPYVKMSEIKNTLFPIIIQTTSLAYFTIAMCFIDSLIERNISFMNEVFIPYFPGARQDRLLKSGDMLFTLKYVSREINRRQLKPIVLDPHSSVFYELIKRQKVITPADIIERFYNSLDNYCGIISPDEGAKDRARNVCFLLKVGTLIEAKKKRNEETGELSGFELIECPDYLKGGHFLVIDDICDGGGTFLGLADEIDKAGITADLYVTHGLFTKGTEALLKRYKKVICTDSVISDKPGVEVIDFVEKFISGEIK